MKRKLIGTTALVVATTFAASAAVAHPLKLSLGGFASVFVGYAEQDDGYLDAVSQEVTDVDVKGDNEIHFKAKSMLNNGLTVGAKIEMEAGGRAGAAGDRSIDEYHISLGGNFGTILAGADDNALYAVAHRSPHMGGRLFDAALNDGDLAAGDGWILKPGNASSGLATAVDTGGDSESISYMSPSIGGLMFAATYMPDADQGRNDASPPTGTNTLDAYAVGLAYSAKMNRTMINADVGVLIGDAPNVDEHKEYQAGLQVSYGGLIFGGGYRMIQRDVPSTFTNPSATDDLYLDSDSWEVGVGYKRGPYGVALGYLSTTRDSLAGSAAATAVHEDTTEVVQLTSEYAVGHGVMLVGGLGYASYEDGNDTTAAGENSGWVATTGLSLSF